MLRSDSPKNLGDPLVNNFHKVKFGDADWKVPALGMEGSRQ